jgi:hypothetical protein
VKNRAQEEATTAAADWISSFGDPQLELVVAEAIENNLNLRVAAAGLQIAEQIARKAGAPLYPRVSVSANAAGLGGFKADTATNQSGISPDVFWELDLWGRIRAGKAAAGADYRAATADYQFAALSLAGQAAKAWFQAVELKQQVRLSEEAVALYRRNLDLARIRFTSGLVTELDTHLAGAQLAATVDQLEASLVQAEQGALALEDDLAQARASVANAEASLVTAQQQVTSLDASLDTAIAAVAQTEAQVSLAKLEYDRVAAAQEQDPGEVSATIVDTARQNYLALQQAPQQVIAQQVSAQAAVDSVLNGENTILAQAEAQLRQARATESKARLSLESVIDGENTTVAQIRAQLRQARLNLDWTTIAAPADGFVTNFQLREGFVGRGCSRIQRRRQATSYHSQGRHPHEHLVELLLRSYSDSLDRMI